MINKIELIDIAYYEEKCIIIDVNLNTLTIIENNVITKKENITLNKDDLKEIIKSFTLSWKNTYKSNTILDGKRTVLNIYTNLETISYTFINKYPENYNEFNKTIKKLVNL